MKKLAYTILSAVLVFTTATRASAQETSTQTRSVSGYSAIASGGPFDVHIKMDGHEGLKIEADANIINDIETVVEDGTLKIRFKDREYRRYHNIHKADIYVSARSLNALTNSGSGNMNVEGTISTSEKFRVVLSGSGSISTAIKSEGLSARLSGSGSIKLRGSTGDADMSISGSGQIQGRELRAQAVHAGITGSGNVYINAEKTVSARITGSGNVVYSGSASITDSRTLGSGRVSRAD